MCSQKYRKMINNLHFTSGIYPDLAKSSKGWFPLFLPLRRDDCDFGYKQKIPLKPLHHFLCFRGIWTNLCPGISWCWNTTIIHTAIIIIQKLKEWDEMCPRLSCDWNQSEGYCLMLVVDIPVLGGYQIQERTSVGWISWPDITRYITSKIFWISHFLISEVISLSTNLKIMRSGHVMSRQGKRIWKFDI